MIVTVPTAAVQALAAILADRGQSTLMEIHQEYQVRYPNDPCAGTRRSAIRNKLQRHCATSAQYQHRFAIFETPERGIWRLAEAAA